MNHRRTMGTVYWIVYWLIKYIKLYDGFDADSNFSLCEQGQASGTGHDRNDNGQHIIKTPNKLKKFEFFMSADVCHL